MANPIVDALISNIAIPELMAFIRGHIAGSGGKLPSDEQVIAEFNQRADRIVATGEAFIASKG